MGSGTFVAMPRPVMGAEDFSYVLQHVPGSMAFLGVCPDDEHWSTAAPNHSNLMRVNEDAMRNGVASTPEWRSSAEPYIVKRRLRAAFSPHSNRPSRDPASVDACLWVDSATRQHHKRLRVGGKGERRIVERIDQAGTPVDRNMHCARCATRDLDGHRHPVLEADLLAGDVPHRTVDFVQCLLSGRAAIGQLDTERNGDVPVVNPQIEARICKKLPYACGPTGVIDGSSTTEGSSDSRSGTGRRRWPRLRRQTRPATSTPLPP